MRDFKFPWPGKEKKRAEQVFTYEEPKYEWLVTEQDETYDDGAWHAREQYDVYAANPAVADPVMTMSELDTWQHMTSGGMSSNNSSRMEVVKQQWDKHMNM